MNLCNHILFINHRIDFGGCNVCWAEVATILTSFLLFSGCLHEDTSVLLKVAKGSQMNLCNRILFIDPRVDFDGRNV